MDEVILGVSISWRFLTNIYKHLSTLQQQSQVYTGQLKFDPRGTAWRLLIGYVRRQIHIFLQKCSLAFITFSQLSILLGLPIVRSVPRRTTMSFFHALGLAGTSSTCALKLSASRCCWHIFSSRLRCTYQSLSSSPVERHRTRGSSSDYANQLGFPNEMRAGSCRSKSKQHLQLPVVPLPHLIPALLSVLRATKQARLLLLRRARQADCSVCANCISTRMQAIY